MKRIRRRLVVAGGVVLLDKDGRVLDGTTARGNYARVASSPYGPKFFRVESPDGSRGFFLDYVVLPNGDYYLVAEGEPPSTGRRQVVVAPADAARAAFELTEWCLSQVDHETTDRWEFVRAVCRRSEETRTP